MELTLNHKDTGYRGIWYYNQPSGDEYVYKYSGGLGTYCAKHRPFAVYRPEVDRTFFCYGGTPVDGHLKHSEEDLRLDRAFSRQRPGFLLHMVSYFDHKTGLVPRPTILLDKETADAHDNPIISVDDDGTIWIFSTSHGLSRPSYVHRSTKPYDIDHFERVDVTYLRDGEKLPMDNFSYMQAWHLPGRGFINFVTRYKDPSDRTLFFMTSPDGVSWSEWTRLAAIDKGHYQISICSDQKAVTAFNYHPEPQGLNWRTNLYYLETPDFGRSWQNAAGEPVSLPLTAPNNNALVHDYAADGLKVYLKDIRLDPDGNPVILVITSEGYESGPENGPRTWTLHHWDGHSWHIRTVTTSDNNYDMGSLYIEDDGTWRIIAPTETGPQAYNPGGEMAMWVSTDSGRTWEKSRQLTRNSERNHTYARSPVSAHPDFYALWADGNARQASKSCIYFCDKAGQAYRLPEEMEGDFARPIRIS
ncbi:MAG: BNR-4 repeat-containing protein [bacterium]|nr:BNR-4 repeat-containing protein [bacterium]